MQVLDAQEVEMLTCGLSTLSSTELYDRTAYRGAYSELGTSHTVWARSSQNRIEIYDGVR